MGKNNSRKGKRGNRGRSRKNAAPTDPPAIVESRWNRQILQMRFKASRIPVAVNPKVLLNFLHLQTGLGFEAGGEFRPISIQVWALGSALEIGLRVYDLNPGIAGRIDQIFNKTDFGGKMSWATVRYTYPRSIRVLPVTFDDPTTVCYVATDVETSVLMHFSLEFRSNVTELFRPIMQPVLDLDLMTISEPDEPQQHIESHL